MAKFSPVKFGAGRYHGPDDCTPDRAPNPHATSTDKATLKGAEARVVQLTRWLIRPRNAITEAEAFAAGRKRTAALRTAAWSAYTAAREVEEAPAANAAHAASHAAAAAFLHPLATPHQVKHVLGAAVHQALARELDAGNDTSVGREHLDWAASLASPAVRSVLHRLPSPRRGRGRFSELLNDLDTELRK